MSDIRCQVCNMMLGRRLPNGDVEIREKKHLVARVRWGTLGCPRCGASAVLDVVPTRAAMAQDQWTVVGVSVSDRVGARTHNPE